jgi:hypothetical protein
VKAAERTAFAPLKSSITKKSFHFTKPGVMFFSGKRVRRKCSMSTSGKRMSRDLLVWGGCERGEEYDG